MAIDSQAQMSAPLVPGAFTRDTTVHIVLNDFGEVGAAYVETDGGGEYSNPIRVAAFNTCQGWSCDVTKYIAQRILDLSRPTLVA